MNETDQAAQDGNPAQTIQPRHPESGRTARAQSPAILQGLQQIMIPARPAGEPVGQLTRIQLRRRSQRGELETGTAVPAVHARLVDQVTDRQAQTLEVIGGGRGAGWPDW